MSDFDREAEREKLREKYERDKQKREASERMSELLLQGATMTNRHCPECHSPVFRYEGREFCPTCEKEVTEDGELPDPDSQRDTAEGDDTESEAEDGVDTEPVGGVGTDSPSEGDAEAAAETDSEVSPEPSSETQPAPARDTRPARVQPPARRDPNTEARRTDIEDAGGTEDGTLRDAEARLVREIATLTRRVEETRDVGRKRDLLAAAREAAETLETVRRL